MLNLLSMVTNYIILEEINSCIDILCIEYGSSDYRLIPIGTHHVTYITIM